MHRNFTPDKHVPGLSLAFLIATWPMLKQCSWSSLGKALGPTPSTLHSRGEAHSCSEPGLGPLCCPGCSSSFGCGHAVPTLSRELQKEGCTVEGPTAEQSSHTHQAELQTVFKVGFYLGSAFLKPCTTSLELTHDS